MKIYGSPQEYVQACNSREETITAVTKRVNDIIQVHKYMSHHGQRNAVPCMEGQAQLVADVLEFVIADIFHNDAEQNYLFNVEMKEGDDEQRPDKQGFV